MKNLLAQDRFSVTSREVTPEGFLQAPGALARVGIYLYRARELGLDKALGMDRDKVVKLYKPPEELFNPETLASFDRKPVTIDHPAGYLVTADNWQQVSVGDVHGVTCDGDCMQGKLLIRSKKAIDTVQAGKSYLSNGYSFDLDMTPGRTPKGEEYDGIQRNIRGNHVAIVDAARGGSACRIADHNIQQGDKKMKLIVVDGIPVEVEDNAAGIIQKLIGDRDAANTARDAATTELTQVKEQHVKDLQAKDSQIADLQAQVLTPAQLEAKVADRQKLVGDAKTLLPEIAVDGKSDEQIQREVLTAVVAKDCAAKPVVEAILAGKTAADAETVVLGTAFRAALAAGVAVATTTAADSAIAAALTSGKQVGDGAASTKLVGREAFLERQRNAWQKK